MLVSWGSEPGPPQEQSLQPQENRDFKMKIPVLAQDTSLEVTVREFLEAPKAIQL